MDPRSKIQPRMLRRAVFSDQQRKGLELAFLKQKYISKPERKKLANRLNLKDSQVVHPIGDQYAYRSVVVVVFRLGEDLVRRTSAGFSMPNQSMCGCLGFRIVE